MRHQILLPMIMPIVLVATFQATRSWGDLYFLLGFGIIGWIMKKFSWPRPPMVLGFVLGPIFERYLFLSTEIYGNAWMLRPVVIGIAILIAWALYRPLRETGTRLWHEFRDLKHSHFGLTPRTWFTIAAIVFILGAIVTSAGWPEIEQVVPRTACWAALVVACINLITELFGADKATTEPHGHGAVTEQVSLDPKTVIARAATFFGWLIGLVVLAALIGFIPAIGVFVILYMGVGFREPMPRALVFGVCMAVFCWGVFDRGLRVPWPLATLGDLVPQLREYTGLM
jgi:hypothetical protein